MAHSGTARGSAPDVVTRLLHPSAPVGRPPSDLNVLLSGPRVTFLTQAGDVGPATWWRHNALGVPAGNVVVNLSSCKIKHKVGLEWVFKL